MKVLIACEFSGIVRQAFRNKGFDAWSCDLLPCEDNSPYHIQCDVREILNDNWILMIAHPPCNYLCNSGVSWLHRRPERWKKLEKAIKFFLELWNAPIPHICIENPVPHKYARQKIGRPTQYIQPYQFGEFVTKKTGLWLKNLPPLRPTKIIPKKQVIQKIIMESPSKDRWKNRSRTFKGIAEAMAEQWAILLGKQ
ncbi:MAG TPA: hypothetical protein ENG63_07510 [Candidatus Desulfofervidus auxilii]|uniref:DNA cytosine methyltransferase n=1 Tax=Desulfofervidus auxilii TaxID=1621989 RepID=A0A7C0Y677_DESA2|nr:hypothetical protein [Candidatus Desulfofervidus auxilii]